MYVRNRSSVLHGYVAAVTVAGVATVAAMVAIAGNSTHLQAPAAFWLFAAGLVVSDRFYLTLPYKRDVVCITTADAFAFALLLGWGVTAATVTVALASAVADALERRALLKVLFNAGQYAVLMAAAGAVYELAGGGWPFAGRFIPAAAAAAIVYYLGNLLLLGVITSLAYQANFVAELLRSLRLETGPTAMLFGLAPILVVVADRSLGLLPLAMLPIAAVYLAFRNATQAEENRAAAERAARHAEALATEQARLVQAERLLVERLQESDRLKEDLLATVSHELRTPLAGMLGALFTLQTRHGQLSASQHQDLVGMALRQGDRLKGLIEQLLEAARFEHAAGEPAALKLVDGAELAREALAAARVAHPGRTIELRAHGSLPVRVAPEVVAQVLGNLVDNAAKYSPDGAVIRLRAERVGGLAVLAVEDQGPGVPPGERERIFQRFTQLDSGATRRAGGVGLGLYIARQLAQAQGGELLVAEGSVGGGARFELRLPLAAGDYGQPAERPVAATNPLP
jgi:signal transduction histidine kinase